MRSPSASLDLLWTVGRRPTLCDDRARRRCLQDLHRGRRPSNEDDTSGRDEREDGSVEEASAEEETAYAEEAYDCVTAACDDNDCATDQGS